MLPKLSNHPTPWLEMGLQAKDVNPIPSMISEDEVLYLRWLAQERYTGAGEIVDAGPLLGGSTVSLASGLQSNSLVPKKEKRIHSYDLFKYFSDFTDRALIKENLNDGDSVLPIFLCNTAKFREMIEVHPGDIQRHYWKREPIEILFIDCAKSWEINNHITREFFGSLIPGQSIVVHQDYFHYACPWIHIQMEFLSNYFSVIHAPLGGTLGFLLTAEIPRDMFSVDLFKFPAERLAAMMDSAAQPFQGLWKLLVYVAKAELLAQKQAYGTAAAVLRKVRRSPDWDDLLKWDVEQVEKELRHPGLRRIASYYRAGGLKLLAQAAVTSLKNR
jgi:hypothetical protein